MSAEWKPGDVVAATVGERENVRLIAGWSRYEPKLRWCEMSPRWGDGDDDECWFMPDRVTNHRRLVAIDPEDMESVERLADVIAKSGVHRVRVPRVTETNGLSAALREFAAPKPPRPEEPTGLGAVVEAIYDNRFVRDNESEFPWRRVTSGMDGEHCKWRDIDVVKVLSEGVR